VSTAVRLVPSDDPNAYKRWVRRQRAYGRWEPFVDAEPVRAHVRTVMAATGIGWRVYADRAGVPRATVTYLLYGHNGQAAKGVTPENARKLLAVQADARGVVIPAAGTARRLQVLVGEGWPQIHLGPPIGTHPQYVSQIIQLKRVAISTADAVARVYVELSGVDPLAAGVGAQSVLRARNLAARNNWHDRAYWADVDRIDDPEFDPDARQLRIEQIAEDGEFLLATGLDTNQVAERLGITRDYLTKALRETAGKPVAA
jgi:hypothetical protein